jgi:hypothetical protein
MMGASVCAAIGLSLSIGPDEASSAARAVEVGEVNIVGDDEIDRFVGSGAVFLP